MGEKEARGAEEVTKRSFPTIRTTFIRDADPYLQNLMDIDTLVEDVRDRLTSHPPPNLSDDFELEGGAEQKPATKRSGSV